MSSGFARPLAITPALAPSLTDISLPSRALIVSIPPSTFSICPRMRTGGDDCAQTAEAVTIKARPATPSARLVDWFIDTSQFVTVLAIADRLTTPRYQAYSRNAWPTLPGPPRSAPEVPA